MGLGKTGVSCARYLAARGERVAIADSRAEPPGLDVVRDALPDVALFLGGFDRGVFEQAERLIVSPGVSARDAGDSGCLEPWCCGPGRHRSVRRGLARPADTGRWPLPGRTARARWRRLIAQMAEASGVDAEAGGNLGKPALDLLADRRQLYVLELSSFQLETMSVSPPTWPAS